MNFIKMICLLPQDKYNIIKLMYPKINVLNNQSNNMSTNLISRKNLL
jgi:hypothetical protein